MIFLDATRNRTRACLKPKCTRTGPPESPQEFFLFLSKLLLSRKLQFSFLLLPLQLELPLLFLLARCSAIVRAGATRRRRHVGGGIETRAVGIIPLKACTGASE